MSSSKSYFVWVLVAVHTMCLSSCSSTYKGSSVDISSIKTDPKTDPKAASTEGSDIISFETDDGVKRKCKLLNIIKFEDQEYGILEDLADGAIAPMRFIDKGDKAIFREIPTEDEFNRVTAHITELTKEN